MDCSVLPCLHTCAVRVIPPAWVLTPAAQESTHCEADSEVHNKVLQAYSVPHNSDCNSKGILSKGNAMLQV